MASVIVKYFVSCPVFLPEAILKNWLLGIFCEGCFELPVRFVQLLISATSKAEAKRISDLLVRKRLVAGTLVFSGDANYWWNQKIAKKKYYNISAFSVSSNKAKIISLVKRIHSDACPIVAIWKIDGNREFLNWVLRSVKK